jgi:hypothetical protein
MNIAMVLIPCCKEKQVAASSYTAHNKPVDPRLTTLRKELRAAVCATPELACHRANQEGWLTPKPRLTPARNLYQGKGYTSIVGLWATPNVHIFIVSAAMGLVHPDEELPEYELMMGDKLSNGEAVYKFWLRNHFSDVIHDVAKRLGVTHLWSLLPDSLPKFPYQQIVVPCWNRDQYQCHHVKVYNESGHSAGSGSGVKRSEWLKTVIEKDRGLLVGEQAMSTEFESIPRFNFKYEC